MSANSDEFDEDEARGVQSGVSPNEEQEEEEEEEEEDSDEEESEDDEESGKPPEGAYDPADYANLPVTTEIR